MNSDTVNAANIIRSLIVGGNISINQVLRIEDICQQHHLQKPHVAEAIARLENEGFLMYSEHGPMVRKISSEEISEWLQKRFNIELDIVEKLASEMDGRKLSILEESIMEQERMVQSMDVVRFLELNAEFHYHLAALAGFPTAAHWFRLESARLKITEIKALNDSSKFRDCFLEHVEIVNALKDMQPERARNAMKQHLDKTAERMKSEK